MARNILPRNLDERLDRAGRAVVRSAARVGAEAEEAANAPFLYARVRARIEERRREAEAGANWLALLQVARRAVPTMAFVAALAAALLFWAASFGARQDGGRAGERFAFVSDEVVFGSDAGVESAVLAGSGQLSHDEILNMVVNRSGREGVRR
ncbi:MAG TPA: hypothetical protein VK421_10465 [Pyrinomonadaceae bacterium]|nr:hypothetical protein [Pyrinomonadaceae bacterium]